MGRLAQIILAFANAYAHNDSSKQGGYMGSGYSKAVKAAFKHVMNGLSVPEAAKKAGCAKSTVYRYPPYQEHVKAKKQS